ncbi:MAG: M23 family metallopeptidase, partial [Spirochaetales bacterium]|nr:M23 family metallopeptidase [Spirochaetales bacterium]
PASGTPAAQSPPPALSSPSQSKDRTSVDTLLIWPVEGTASYLNGKLEGIQFKTVRGASVRAIASGTVVSAGASRGYGEVVFIQNKAGFVYVYGGNETLLVKTGDVVESGKIIAKVGIDARDGSAVAYFFVFRNGQPVDPALAPRE